MIKKHKEAFSGRAAKRLNRLEIPTADVENTHIGG